MAKHSKKTTTTPKKTSATVIPSNDLDNGYENPIKSRADITTENIKSVIIHSRYIQILIVLTVLGFCLRFYNLTFNSIWLDEASTVGLSQGSFQEIWNLMLTGDYNPPLFQWFTHFMLMFGNTEFTLRFVPALAGVLAIPVMYCIGKEFIDRNVGLIVAAAATVSPFLIFYAQEARAYTLMFLVVAIEFLFYLRATRTNTTKDWILFGLFAAVSFWTHFYTLVITAALFLFTFITLLPKIREDIRSLKNVVMAGVVVIITTLPLILVIVPLYLKRTASPPTYGVQGSGIITETLTQLLGFNGFISAVVCALFVIGIIQLYLSDRQKAWLVVWALGLLFAVSVFMSYRIPMLPRYLIFASIFLFLGVAGSYKSLYALTENKYAVYCVMAVFLLFSLTFLPSYYTNLSKDDWRGFSQVLGTMTKPGDVVVLVPGYNSQPLDYYYSNTTHGTIEINNVSASAVELSNVTAPSGNKILFVITGDIYSANPAGDALAWLNQNTHLSYQHGSIGIMTKPTV